MLPQVETPIAHTHETHQFSAPEFPLLSNSLLNQVAVRHNSCSSKSEACHALVILSSILSYPKLLIRYDIMFCVDWIGRKTMRSLNSTTADLL